MLRLYSALMLPACESLPESQTKVRAESTSLAATGSQQEDAKLHLRCQRYATTPMLAGAARRAHKIGGRLKLQRAAQRQVLKAM